MNCKKCHDEIEEAESGQPLSQIVTIHLESCPNCMAFQNEHMELRRMIGSLEVVSAPANFDFRLRARLAELKGQQAPGRVVWSRFTPAGWSLGLAATFVIVLVVGIIVRQFIATSTQDSGPSSVVRVVPDSPIVPTAPPTATARNIEPAVVPSVGSQPRETVSQRHERTNKTSEIKRSTVATELSPNEGGGSVDSAVSTAANVLPIGISDPTLSRSAVAYPVQTAIQGSSVSLSDGNTKRQTVLLRTVTFGGQDVFEHSGAKDPIVPIAQRVW